MGRLIHELRLFFIALQFFTRVPVPAWVGYSPAWMNASARHYPAVGLLVGAWGAAITAIAAVFWPLTVAVGLGMVATVWLSGGFHEDGLADTCDGLGGAVSRERALLIMKDSRLGSYGALGLVAVLGLKAAALHALAVTDRPTALAWIVAAHGLSRVAPVLLLRLLPYAGDAEHAKAKPMAMQVSGGGLRVALGWAAVVLVVLLVLGQLLAGVGAAVGALALVVVWMRRWLRRRLGGYTGDTLGAAQQFAELAVYLALLAVLSASAVPPVAA